jgi:hypothetical protein
MLLLQPFRLCVLETMKKGKPPEVVGRSFWCRCKDFVASIEEDFKGADHFVSQHEELHAGRTCGAFRIEKRGLCNHCMKHGWPVEADAAEMNEAYEKWWTEETRMRCRAEDLRNPWNIDLEQNDQALQAAPAVPLPRRACAGTTSKTAAEEGSSASGGVSAGVAKSDDAVGAASPGVLPAVRREKRRRDRRDAIRIPSAQRKRARSPIVLATEGDPDLQHKDDGGHHASRSGGSGSSSRQRQLDPGHDRERVRGYREGRAASSRQGSRGRARASGTVYAEPSRHHLDRGSGSLSRVRDPRPSSTRRRRRSSSRQRQLDPGHDRERVHGDREGRIASSRQRSRGRARASGTVHEPSRHYLGRGSGSLSLGQEDLRRRGYDLLRRGIDLLLLGQRGRQGEQQS